MKTVGIRHSYRSFSDRKKISEKLYKEIAERFLMFTIEKIFEGHTVRLPEKFGKMHVTGIKIKPKIDKVTGEIVGVAPDWKSTKEKGVKIYFLNEHTQSVRYKLKWSKDRMSVENKNIYSFRLTRGEKGNKNKLAKLIKQGKEFYVIND